MDGQEHFVLPLAVGKRGFLVRDPEELRLSIPAADVCAQGDEGLEDRLVHGVWLRRVGRAFDRHGAMVIFRGGGTPRAVLLLDIQCYTSVGSDAVVGACLTLLGQEDIAQHFDGELSDDAVRRDAVDGVVAESGMVRAECGVDDEEAVRSICS